MKIKAFFLAGVLTVIPAAIIAQDRKGAEPPMNGPNDKRPDRQNPIAAGTGAEPFADIGNSAAKEIAESEGITVGEATSRLRRMHAAGQARRVLDEVDGFASVSSSGDTVTIYAKQGSEAARNGAKLARGADTGFRGRVEVVEVAHSMRDLKLTVDQLEETLGDRDEVYGYRISRSKGEVAVLSGKPNETRGRIGEVAAPDGIEISVENSEPIQLTQSLRGGTINNADPGTGGECPMFGFMVVTDDGTKHGITTAGHFDSNDARYDGYYPSRVCSGSGNSLNYQRRWTGGSSSTDPATFQLGLDIAWFRDSVGVQPIFFDGTYNQWVTGVKWTATGDRVCKYGRKTARKLCGTVTDDIIYSRNYGYMSQAIAEPGNTPFNLVGDSGGPVWFSSGTAIGFTHGRRNDSELLFMDASALEQRNTGIKVAVCQYAPCYDIYY